MAKQIVLNAKGIATTGATAVGVFSKLRFFKWFFFFLFFAILVFHGVVQSIQTRSVSPFLYETVGSVISADEGLYQDTRELEVNGIQLKVSDDDGFIASMQKFFAKGGIWLRIISKIGMIFYIHYFVFKFVWRQVNESERWGAFYKTIVTMVILQMLLSSTLLNVKLVNEDPTVNIKEIRAKSEWEQFIYFGWTILPYKGLGYFIKTMIFNPDVIVNPSYNIIRDNIIDSPDIINGTIT